MEILNNELNLEKLTAWQYSKMIYGYDKEITIIDISQKLIELYEKNNSITLPAVNFLPINLADAINNSQSFLSNLFTLHDIRFISDDYLNILSEYELETTDDLLNEIAKISFIHPFKLPIILEPTDALLYGFTNEFSIILEDEEYLKKTSILFNNISLSKRINKLFEISYIHELVHTQLDSNKFSIKYYINSEVLNIFLELLSSSKDEKLLDYITKLHFKLLNNQILFLYDYFNNGELPVENAEESSKYIISTLKAYSLFNLYQKSSSKIKKEILLSIQKIFNEEKSLEDLLSHYDITTNSGLKLILD